MSRMSALLSLHRPAKSFTAPPTCMQLRNIITLKSPVSQGFIIGIETTCDDTGVAIIRHGIKAATDFSSTAARPRLAGAAVVADVVSSQHSLNAEHGGVVPLLAARAHQSNLPVVLQAAASEAALLHADGVSVDAASSDGRVTAVAVAAGPGLALCLRTGVASAVSLASRLAVPVVPVHHLEAHMLIPRLVVGPDSLPFPYLCLLVSGGHSMIGLVVGPGRHVNLGGTVDDAVGECFDKVARMLGLGTPHSDSASGSNEPAAMVHLGSALESLASRGGDPAAIRFPKPLSTGPLHARLRDQRAAAFATPIRLPGPVGDARSAPWSVDVPVCALSLSGLKSAVNRYIEKVAPTAPQDDSGGNPASSVSHQHRLQQPDQQRLAANIAASFQSTVSRHVCEQVDVAIQWCIEQGRMPTSGLAGLESASGSHDQPSTPLRLVVVGGVASNTVLRSAIKSTAESHGVEVIFPPPRLCVDNGTMISWAALEMMAAEEEDGQAGFVSRMSPQGGMVSPPQDGEATGGGEPHYVLNPRWKLGTALADAPRMRP